MGTLFDLAVTAISTTFEKVPCRSHVLASYAPLRRSEIVLPTPSQLTCLSYTARHFAGLLGYLSLELYVDLPPTPEVALRLSLRCVLCRARGLELGERDHLPAQCGMRRGKGLWRPGPSSVGQTGVGQAFDGPSGIRNIGHTCLQRDSPCQPSWRCAVNGAVGSGQSVKPLDIQSHQTPDGKRE